MFENKSFIKGKDIDNITDLDSIYPIRLWELNYENNKGYSFINFMGENVLLKGKDKYLWEMASGLNSINEIITFSESPFKDNSEDIQYVVKFYINLYYNYALLLIR